MALLPLPFRGLAMNWLNQQWQKAKDFGVLFLRDRLGFAHKQGCRYCGGSETLQHVLDEINGTVCEEDVYCKTCRRHLHFFAYGSIQPGSGFRLTPEIERKLYRSHQQLTAIQQRQFLLGE